MNGQPRVSKRVSNVPYQVQVFSGFITENVQRMRHLDLRSECPERAIKSEKIFSPVIIQSNGALYG
jgi:hypothetical protein